MNKNTANIVLVTMKGGGNFGTSLQSYALHKKLESLGYQVSFLHSLPIHYGYKEYLKYLLKILHLYEFARKIIHPNRSLQQIKLEQFDSSNLNEVNIYTKYQEKKLVEKTSCFVTGSDQIWNTYHHFNPVFFLSFVDSKKRVAYASSIGTTSIKDEYREEVKKQLLKFSYIGVREYEAVGVLSALTGRNDIQQVLDPTFLLEPNDWGRLAKDAKYEEYLPQDYLLCYLIGNNTWYKEQLEDVKEKLGMKDIIILPAIENPDFACEGATIYRNASPIEFVDLLQRAKFVCTDSFHATALSINLSIPFVEFVRFRDDDKKSQNSRIYDVLNHFGLSSRIYKKESIAWAQPVNYRPVQEILIHDREVSLNYLVNAIEN